MVKNMNNKLQKKNYFITFIITFGAYLLKIFTINTYILYPDQIGALATAIKLCHLPWNTAISYSKYYGFGFFWLYGLLFKITDNPHVIMWIHFLLITFLIALVSCLILYIAVELLEIQKVVILYVVPTSIAFICSNHSFSSLLNAPVVYCSVWVAFCFLIKSYKEKNIYRIIYSVISALFFLYILFLHETVMALYLAIFIACILVKILWREWIVSMIPFWSIIGGGYILGKYVRNKVIAIVWAVENPASLDNTSAFQHTSLWFLENKKSFKIFLDTIFTNFAYMNEATFGLAILAFVTAMCIIVSCLVKYKLKKRILKENKIQFLVMIIAIVTATIIILGLGASWGRRAYQAYIGISEVGSSYRGYAYGRYYMPYFSPAILVAISYIMKIQKKSKIVFGAILGYLIFMIYYLFVVHSYYFKEWGIARLARIILLEDDPYGWNIFFSMLIPLGMLVILYYRGQTFGKRSFMVVMIFFTVILPYWRQDFTSPIIKDNTYLYYEFGKQVQNKGYEIKGGYATSGYLCRIQFELQNIEIKELSPNLDEEIIAFVTASEEEGVLDILQMDNLKKVCLNENLLIIYRGKYYDNMMNELGYETVEIT